MGQVIRTEACPELQPDRRAPCNTCPRADVCSKALAFLWGISEKTTCILWFLGNALPLSQKPGAYIGSRLPELRLCAELAYASLANSACSFVIAPNWLALRLLIRLVPELGLRCEPMRAPGLEHYQVAI